MNDTSTERSTPPPPVQPRGSEAWWKWLLGVLVLGAAVLLLRSYLAKEGPVAPSPQSAPPPPVVVRPPSEPAEMVLPPVVTFERELPDGTVIRVPSNGAETQLIAFVADPARPPDEKLWFTLDRVDFKKGSAALRSGSEAELDNVAAILKAWPFVKLKFGVATDEGGDAAANLELSRERASGVMNELISRGIAKERLRSEGYGGEFPVTEVVNGGTLPRSDRVALQVTGK